MSHYLASYTNREDAMTAVVFESRRGGGTFGVALHDNDSGKFVGASLHGFTSLAAAKAKAAEVLMLPADAPGPHYRGDITTIIG